MTRSDRLLTFFGVERRRDEPPVDVWPLGLAPIIRLAQDGSGNKRVDDAIFGLLPHFQAELAAGRKTYNARSETVHKLPSFKQAWSNGWRCIIPCEHIYEPNWESGKSERWRIQRPNATPMGVAGIWREWKGPDGRMMLTFSMLTVNADDHPLMKRFHKPGDEKRMVVILDQSEFGEWLTCPVDQASKFFKQWLNPLEAFPAPLAPRAPKASSVRTLRPDPGPELF